MPTSPSFFVNAPASGTQYTADQPAYEFIPDSGTSYTVTVKAWSGANGTGSLVAVTSITAINHNVTSNTDPNSFTANSANSVNATSSSGTNGVNVFCAKGSYTGGAIGSLEIFAVYTGSPVAQCYVNTGTPASPVWSPAIAYVNTGTPASPVWTQASEVSVNTGTPASPVWTQTS